MYSGLRAINLKSGMKALGKKAFAGSERLNCVNVANNSMSITNGAFDDTIFSTVSDLSGYNST